MTKRLPVGVKQAMNEPPSGEPRRALADWYDLQNDHVDAAERAYESWRRQTVDLVVEAAA